jgi:hypothetical protein
MMMRLLQPNHSSSQRFWQVGAEPREDFQIPHLHEDRDEVSALKALLAFGPSDTTNGVVAGSTRQTWPSTEPKKS